MLGCQRALQVVLPPHHCLASAPSDGLQDSLERHGHTLDLQAPCVRRERRRQVVAHLLDQVGHRAAQRRLPLGMVRSLQYAADEERGDEFSVNQRSLPCVSMPTWCFIYRLGILGWADHRAKGRAACPEDVASVRCYLQAIVSSACVADWCLTLFGDCGHSAKTFRPWVGDLPQQAEFRLPVSAGVVSLQVLLEADTGDAFLASLGKLMPCRASTIGYEQASLPLYELIGVAASLHKGAKIAAMASGLLLQVCWQVGQRILPCGRQCGGSVAT